MPRINKISMKTHITTKQMTSSKIKLKEKIVFPPTKCLFCPKAITLGKKTRYNIDTNHRHLPQTAGFIGFHTCVKYLRPQERSTAIKYITTITIELGRMGADTSESVLMK